MEMCNTQCKYFVSNCQNKPTNSFPVYHCRVRVVKLVEEAVDYISPIGFRIQTELTCWTQTILIDLPREDKWMFNQCHHTEAVFLDGKSRSPASSKIAIPLTIPSSDTSSKALSLAVAESSHQSQNASLKF